MDRNNLSSRFYDKAPASLVYYEDKKTKGESLYLDSDDFANIISFYTSYELYDKARGAAEDGLHMHPDNLDILLEKAYLLLYSNNPNAAKVLAKELLENEPSNEIILLNIELELTLNVEQTDEFMQIIMAVGEVRELLEQISTPENLDTIIDVCYVLLTADKSALFIEDWIDKGLELYAESPQFLEVYVEFLKSTSQLSLASEALNKLIDLDPYNTDYWWLLALNYFEDSEIDKSKEALEFTIATNEDFANAYLILGQVYQLKEQNMQAIAYYKEAIERGCDEQGAAYIYLSNAYLPVNEDMAQEAFNTSIKINTSKDSVRSKIASLEKELIEHEITALEAQVLNTNDRDVLIRDIVTDRGLCNTIENNSKKDTPAITQAEEHLIDAIIALQEGKNKEAYKEALLVRNYRPSATILHELAKLFIELHKPEDAYKTLLEISFLGVNKPEIILELTILSIVCSDIKSFITYNFQLEQELDINNIEEILERLQQTNKIGLLKAFLKFQANL